eukprot:scaffold23525_cov58-Phaeocystis_antarctica.AAC.1
MNVVPGPSEGLVRPGPGPTPGRPAAVVADEVLHARGFIRPAHGALLAMAAMPPVHTDGMPLPPHSLHLGWAAARADRAAAL